MIKTVNFVDTLRLPSVKGAVATRLRDCQKGIMEKIHNKELVSTAKMLRKNMTKEERHLWYDFLRKSEYRFIRQKIIGKYIVDFYCAEAKLVIELDGAQHYEEKGLKNDEERTKFLETYGLKIVRIPNTEVNKNFNGVCEYIDKIVKQSLSQLR